MVRLPPKGVGGEEPPCSLRRDLSHREVTPSSLARVLYSGPFTTISFHLGMNILWGQINDWGSDQTAEPMSSWLFGNQTLEAFSVSYQCQRRTHHLPQCTHQDFPCAFPLSGWAAAGINYCLFWHFFWKVLFRKVRYTGSSTYSFLSLELSTLCLFLSPWITSAP